MHGIHLTKYIRLHCFHRILKTNSSLSKKREIQNTFGCKLVKDAHIEQLMQKHLLVSTAGPPCIASGNYTFYTSDYYKSKTLLYSGCKFGYIDIVHI